MLTVEAMNCSLNALLTAVRNKTGIEFEGIERATEPVAVMVGPAPEGDVISGILAGSRYDFLIIGRPDSPGVIQRVVLSPKGTPTAMTARTPQPQAQPTPEPDEDAADDQSPDEPQDTAMTPPPQASPQQPAPTTPQGPKTPEQLLEEMKQRELQRQQQQGMPPPPVNQVPRKPPQ
jgi:hypothetical protein